MSDTKCIKLVPPCYTMSGEWYDVDKRCYVDPPESPVYVRIRGQRREAIRAKWLWRWVARWQG